MVCLSRRVAGFAASLLLLAVAITATTPAAAQPAIANATQARAAADYLVSQLIDGNHLNSSYTGQADVGATSDALLGLVASGSHTAEVMAMSAWLETQAGSYASQGAGASGKLILVAAAVAATPQSWGGVDLVALTTSALTTDPTAGGSSFSAALAILGLRTAGAEVPSAAVDALVDAQDSNGAFGYLSAGVFTPDADTTALVIQALQRLSPAASTDAALESALTWLRSQLSADQWTTYSPANTAGLAIPALRTAGVDASGPMAWLLGQQLTDGGFAASADGTSSDAYATAQAILGVTGVALGTAVVVVDPSPTNTHTATSTPTAASPTEPGPSAPDSPDPSVAGSAPATDAPLTPRLPDTGTEPSSALALLAVTIIVIAAARSRLRSR